MDSASTCGTPQPPGFFGKVPARGDFVSRRMPPGFAAAWDEWLGMFTTAVQAAAGPAWPDIWLTAPLWHFAIGRALAPPFGAAGVLVGSVDRVGRMFPFTILGPSVGVPNEAWSAAVEDMILAALEDDFDPATLDAGLQRIGPPQSGERIDAGQSLWWCRGSDHVEPTRALLAGLPDRATATAMVLGAATPGGAPPWAAKFGEAG